MSVEVDVQYAVEAPVADMPSEDDFTQWVAAALAGRRTAAELSLRIVGEEEGTALNQTYRHRTGPTNVLSFPAECPPDMPVPLLGDIVLCEPVIRREAREQGKAARAHWAHLTVHGALHLLGYDHETAGEAAEMERLETEILGGLGMPDPYAGE